MFISSRSINKHGHYVQFLFLISQFLKIFSSKTIWPNKAKFYRKYLWRVLYKISSYHLVWIKNMVILISDWLKFKQIFSFGTRMHNELLLCMNDGFTTTYAISAYHHWCCEFESRWGWSVQHYVIKVCQWLVTGRWFSPGPLVSSTKKANCHNIAEIWLKVALNTIKQTCMGDRVTSCLWIANL